MAYTETVKIGWGSRIGGSFRGIIVGIVLFILAFPLLFWNEGRAVRATKTNAEGAAVVVEASPDSVDPAMEGKLVHVIGEAKTKDILKDDKFGVSENAIRLERSIEMYQWVEESETKEKRNVGGSVTRTTTYTYAKEWCDEAVNSDGFKEKDHVNPPPPVQLGDTDQYARNVSVGVRKLESSQIRAIGRSEPLAVKYKPVGTNEYFDVESAPPDPKVGDVRVTFKVVRPHTVTIVAAQNGSSFMSYTAKTGNSISHVKDGAVDAAGVFAAAERSNAIVTWLLRLAGFLMMLFGLSGVLKPLSVIADVLPILGSIVSFGAGIVSFLLAAVCTLVTIAVAWIAHRPLFACILLAIAAALIWKLVMMRRAKRNEPPTAPAA
ncbi:MAG: TMEM43 family protein [Kiritimatiellae bacterium]|nr:TMEM43 family protein [Kiritimatiellia bacterium]